MDRTQNGLNSEWTQPRRDSTPSGLNPRLGLNPKWTQPRLGLNPEWTELRMGLNLKFISTSNGTISRCKSLEWIQKENTIIYFSQRRLSGPQHMSSAPC